MPEDLTRNDRDTIAAKLSAQYLVAPPRFRDGLADTICLLAGVPPQPGRDDAS